MSMANAADEGLAFEDDPQGVEQPAKRLDRLRARGVHILERLAEAFFETGAQVRCVAGVDHLRDRQRHRRGQGGHPLPVRGRVDEARHRPALRSAEQRWLLRVCRFQVLGDLPGIEDYGGAGLQDRHLALARERECRLVGNTQ